MGSIRNYWVRCRFGGCSQPCKSILITCDQVSFDFSSGSLIAGQGCWAPSSPSAYLSLVFWSHRNVYKPSSFHVRWSSPLGLVLTVCHEGLSLLSKDGTKEYWDPAGKGHSSSGTACLGDTSADSCNNWAVCWQVFVVMVIPSEELLPSYCASGGMV